MNKIIIIFLVLASICSFAFADDESASDNRKDIAIKKATSGVNTKVTQSKNNKRGDS